MNLLDSLLDAIVRLDGDALVMHVGEKPYVVTTSEATNEFRGPLVWGQVELSSRVLTPEAAVSMLGQILPADQRTALDEFGAVEYEVAAATAPAERFTIVAARGGDDIWLEVRRLAKLRAAEPAEEAAVAGTAAAVDEAEEMLPEPAAAPEPSVAEEPVLAAGGADATSAGDPAEDAVVLERPDEAPPEHAPVPAYGSTPTSGSTDQSYDGAAYASIEEDDLLFVDQAALGQVARAIVAGHAWPDDVMTEGDLSEILRASASAMINGEGAGDWYAETEPVRSASSGRFAGEAHAAGVALFTELQTGSGEGGDAPGGLPAMEIQDELELSAEEALRAAREAFRSAGLADEEDSRADFSYAGDPPAFSGDESFDAKSSAAAEQVTMSDESVSEISIPVFRPVQQEAAVRAEGAPASASLHDSGGDDHGAHRHPEVVVPLGRQTPHEAGGDVRGGAAPTLQRLLRLAAARGAATVYVVAGSAPMVRVDGEFSMLDGEPVLTAAFVERLMTELTPQTSEGTPAAPELIADVPEIGRVRCVTFRDHRGPGIIFRMVPSRAISAEGLGLSPEVQALSTEADGLVLVAGGRASGRSTLLTSFVDLINRTRSDHVVTLEPQVEFVHESKRSFISQREVGASADTLAAAFRGALREDPDVVVVEELTTPELVTLALEAADAGKLVFASVPAPSAASAIERILETCPAEHREKMQARLAFTLRGVVSQVLLRRLKGGHVAAREVLINTPAVAGRILEGKTGQLTQAIESGGRFGMITFAESLAALVREGTVHPSHAYRKAPDREGLLARLKREGLDTGIAAEAE